MSNSTAGAYAGDASAAQTYKALEEDATATLVDVRTQAEWNYVGIPDLSPLGRDALFVEWQTYPTGAANPDFVATLTGLVEERGATKDGPIYFLCRSGVRSRAAAIAMTAAGFGACYNVIGGFEGSPDTDRHRGSLEGWKYEGLPWRQS
ncbi:thiosulfate sulfurtransferase [Breoghania corrubedonensis]|uniref:Thiosulfate sulfurtransferase n=1 Tax=Breoghania corrubedonensis TaxID=665038 RepID=A0A2T5VGD3_9HYPH|nr:rhodanese-like domain-containing protein [Breoghania corrubedonensis]PTW62776.1 thiosulfate sulfurtransferase [Breoghania corrubedonensis]